ncbi:MAG: cyclic nucleotide-binding domain-containing protein [Bacteriovoracaceae bacterium]|nr:cyclic nucleotide-binding domain-containing protein [Bacteriovoracaceae bacterium]
MVLPAQATQKKSGIKTLIPGQILFNEGDAATSMYIVQKGQLRLFRPKGKGFVEVAVLRTGEVLGEMAYFDPDSKTRSVSAAAITSVEIIEISFNALDKTMSALNPWFKTLINTLAERLRKTNERVKALENNSVGFSSDYKFFQSADIVKILSVLFLTFRSMSEQREGRWYLNYNKIKTYAIEIFIINEAKMEEFIQLLSDEKIIVMSVDENDASKVLSIKEPDTFRIFQVFVNTQRSLRDEKKLVISPKCEKFLVKVIEECESLPVVDGKVDLEISKIVTYFKEYNLGITLDDFQGAKNAKFCGEYRMDDKNNISTTINIEYLRKMFPVVRFMNSLNRHNELKTKANS